MSSTLILPGETLPMSDPQEIRETLQHEVDAVVDGGYCGLEPTTVVVLDNGEAEVVRVGCGDITPFQG